MSPLTDRQLAKKLRPDSVPEPPAGLLDELRRQIPAEVRAPAPADTENLLPFRRPLPRRVWLAAASVAMLVGGGTLSWLALRHQVGLGEVAEPPRPAATNEFGSPAEARDGSAGAMQPRDRNALGYAGVPSAAPPASAPAYPGRFAEQRGDDRAAQGLRLERQVRGPAQPTEVPTGVRGGAASGAPMALALPPEDAPARVAPPSQREQAELKALGYVASKPDPTAEQAIASNGVAARRQAPAPAPPPPAAITGGSLTDRVDVGTERDAEGTLVAKQAAAPAAAAAAKTATPAAPAEADAAAAPEPAPASTLPPSTGGTREPNDQPYGDVFFKSYGVNPFVDSEDDRLSTFALDVDTGSYNVVRRYLQDGNLPPPEAVRVEELVNAFDYGEPAPSKGDFALTAEAAPDPWAPGDRYLLVRFAIKAREVPKSARMPVTLQTVAAEARAQVEVDPRYVSRWRLVGYENRDVVDERFRDDTLDAGEIGAGHAVSALYELELRPDAPDNPANATLALLRLRWRPAGGAAFREIEQPLRRGAVAKRWEGASRGFRLATVVGRFAEVLRGSYWAKQGAHADDLGELVRRVAVVNEDWPRQERVAELVRLVGRAHELRQRAAEPAPRDR